VLDTLAEIGQISQGRAADVKSKYEAIHSALVAAMEQEKQLLSQAQELHKEAQVLDKPRGSATVVTSPTGHISAQLELTSGLQCDGCMIQISLSNHSKQQHC
jgi:hypothetical protein